MFPSLSNCAGSRCSGPRSPPSSVPSSSASAAHRTHQAAATLTVSFFDSTGAPGTLLRLPRNKIVVRRTTAGRIAVGRRRFRVLGRGRAPIRLRVRVDPVAGRLTDPRGRPQGDVAATPGRRVVRHARRYARRRPVTRPLPAARAGHPDDVAPATPDAPAPAPQSTVTPTPVPPVTSSPTPTPRPVPTETPTPVPTVTPTGDSHTGSDGNADADSRRRRRPPRRSYSPPAASGGHHCPRPRRWIRRALRLSASCRRLSHRTSPTARAPGSRPPGPAHRSTSSAPPSPASA